jgi:uncharacterized protein (TIGR04222 family)
MAATCATYPPCPATPCSAGDIAGAARWQRLASWASDDARLQRRLRRQLRERTGWSAAEADAAILEYLRFCAIAAERGGRVTPSPAIDEVWHLHLTYTRDYWLDFCPHRLGFALHHQPAFGDAGEAQRLRDDYAETLHAYAGRFGMPPTRWWPPRWQRGDRATRRRGGRLAALALWLPSTAAASPLAGTPLDWRGPEFLALYLVLGVIAITLSLLLRWQQRHAAGHSAQGSSPSVWELAYLAGGAERVVDAAVAELHRQQAVVWDPAQRRLLPGPASPPSDPLLVAVLGQLVERTPDIARAARASVLAGLRGALQRRGWWFSAAEAQRIALLSALPLAALAVFGAAKVVVGLLRERPVALLVVLCVLTAVAALVAFLARPGITPAGQRVLREARGRHALTVRAHRGEQVALAVALGGTAVLAGTALAGYHALRQPASSADGGTSSSDSSDSSSSSDAGDGGGSGCGGCGGGGD